MNYWDDTYREKGIVQPKPSEQIIRLVPTLREEGARRVLDHGCGTGRHMRYLAEQGLYIVGTDNSLYGLQEAKKLIAGLDNAALVRADMSSIPFYDKTFDAIICSHVLQHGLQKQRDEAFREFERALRGKGVLFLRTISRRHHGYGSGTEIEPHTFVQMQDASPPRAHHYFSEEELREYLNGFEISRIEHKSSPAPSDCFWQSGLEEWIVLARKK